MPPTKLVYSTGKFTKKPRLTIDFIDVGQGNCVLVTFPSGDMMLVDAGSQQDSLDSPPFKHASDYIAKVANGRAIGCVVLSHGDKDHTAFVPHIPEAQSPAYVHYSGGISTYSDTLQEWIKKMEKRKKETAVFRFKLGGYSNTSPDADFGSDTGADDAHVSVLAANYGKSPNDKSIVLMIEYGNQMVVLPGDAESFTEQWIMAQVPAKVLAGCTLLMPGHHGAYEATSADWAAALKAKVAVISASGANGGYAHPHCATIQVLKDNMLDNQAVDHTIVCSAGKSKPYTPSNTERALLVTATQRDVRWVTDGENVQINVSTLLSKEVFGVVPQFETPLERFDRLEKEGNPPLLAGRYTPRRN
jgi:beta-lactamase superfamily II metal-dependent hydrolase